MPMTLFQAREFVRLYDVLDSSEFGYDVQCRLKDALEKEFEKACCPSKNDGPSIAEIEIARGTFHRISGIGYDPGTPSYVFALNLYRSRTGLGIREAREAFNKAINTSQSSNIVLDSYELNNIKNHYNSSDFDGFEIIAQNYAMRHDCSVEEMQEAIDNYIRTL